MTWRSSWTSRTRSSFSAMVRRSLMIRRWLSRTTAKSSRSTSGRTMLRIKNLESGYENLRVIKDATIHVNPGEIVTIIGANGAGKTTLLKTITGLLRPLAGEILFSGQEIGRMSTEKIVFLGCSLVPEGRQVFA